MGLFLKLAIFVAEFESLFREEYAEFHEPKIVNNARPQTQCRQLKKTAP